jgi:hypothetical protein
VFRFQKSKTNSTFQSVFFKLRFLDLGLNHNKQNVGFRVRVEWGIEKLKVQMEKADEKISFNKIKVQLPF